MSTDPPRGTANLPANFPDLYSGTGATVQELHLMGGNRRGQGQKRRRKVPGPPGNMHELDGHQQYRAPAEPGRNDPCFCGSGIKFKKCSHEAMRRQMEEQRAVMRKEHREGACPTCKAKQGEDQATITVPPGNKARNLTECPDCGRLLTFKTLEPGAPLGEVIAAVQQAVTNDHAAIAQPMPQGKLGTQDVKGQGAPDFANDQSPTQETHDQGA